MPDLPPYTDDLDDMEKLLIDNQDLAGLMEYRKARDGAAQRALDYLQFIQDGGRPAPSGITHTHEDKS